MNTKITLAFSYLGFKVAAEIIRSQPQSGANTAAALPNLPQLGEILSSTAMPFDLVLDVGASEGQFAISARQQGYAGKIVSFEPEDASFQKLESARVGDDKWDAVQLGLGETNGSEDLNVASHNPYFNSSHDNIPGIFDGKQEMTTATLDSWMEERGIEGKRIFLNLDTQGGDLAIVEGAINSLSRIVAIQIKVSVDSDHSQAPKLASALDALKGHGYEIHFMSPVEGYPDERNCTFIRKNP